MVYGGPVLSPTSTNSGDRSNADRRNRSNVVGNDQYNGRSDATSLTGVAGLNASFTSTGNATAPSTDRGNRPDVIGNDQYNGRGDTSGRDPVWWTPRKRECSSAEANVGSSLLSTRTRP